MVVVSSNVPLVELYDFNGRLLAKFDLSEHKSVKERLAFIERDYDGSENTYYHIFRDAYQLGGKLYLLTISGVEEVVFRSILVFDLKDNGLNYEMTIQLPGDWYSSFCVTNDQRLLAFETSMDQLQLFEL